MLQVFKGIQAYTEPRPALVFITSAGVERNANIGDDEAARKKDIPIVQLNPGGVLNHKYAGEWAVRTSELRYTVIRSTGDSPETLLRPIGMQCGSGDTVRRDELQAEKQCELFTPCSRVLAAC